MQLSEYINDSVINGASHILTINLVGGNPDYNDNSSKEELLHHITTIIEHSVWYYREEYKVKWYNSMESKNCLLFYTTSNLSNIIINGCAKNGMLKLIEFLNKQNEYKDLLKDHEISYSIIKTTCFSEKLKF